MVLINKAINEVTLKLVYYGPGLCGKTTNLEKIYANPKLDNKGKMISMSTETDRTLFFDFMPMELGTIGGQKIRVQLYTVPGQVFYDATRKLVLRGADGVVFVADSQASMRDSNIDSLENLKTNLRLNRIDPTKVAIVYQLNKRDLPAVSTVEEMRTYLKVGDDATCVEASAITGAGVTATLRAAVSRILDNLKANVDVTLYEQPELRAPDMSARAGVTTGSAGTPKLSLKSDAKPAAPASAPAAAPFIPPAEPQPVLQMAAVAAAAPAAAAPVAAAAPMAVESSPFAIDVEEDPFAHMAIVEPQEVHVEFDDPFATPATELHDVDAERQELQSMLANARAIVASLEDALARARENERAIAAKL